MTRPGVSKITDVATRIVVAQTSAAQVAKDAAAAVKPSVPTAPPPAAP
jgi:hypothetical protein